MKIGSLWTLLVTLFLLSAPSVYACVGCRTPGEKTEDLTVRAGIALSWSVLFMLATVGTVLGFLGWYMAKHCRQLNAEHARILDEHDRP